MATTQQISAVLVAMYQGFTDGQGFTYQGIAADRVQANYAPLIDGKIAYSEPARHEQSFYPRMIVIPDGITHTGSREGVNTAPRVARPVVPLAQLNPLAHKWIDVKAEMWGADEDDCVDLYDQFCRALAQVVSSGSYKVGRAKYGKPGAATAGRRLYINVSWWGVITIQPIPVPLQFAPAGVTSAGGVFIDNAGNPTGTQSVAY